MILLPVAPIRLDRIPKVLTVCAAVWMACLLASAATAQQPATVRAIEHPEFSRLVLSLPANVDTSLDVDGQTARIGLAGAQTDYDFSGIFDRMPRDRIRAVNTSVIGSDTEVTLSLGCTCTVRLEPIGSRFLAIDVRRGEEYGRTRPRFFSRSTAPEGGEVPEGEENTLIPAPSGAQFASPASESALDRTEVDPSTVVSDAPPQQTAEDAQLTSDASIAPSPVEAARGELVRQLERAVEQGLLSIAPSVPEGSPELAPSSQPSDPVQVPNGSENVRRAPRTAVPTPPEGDTLDPVLSAESHISIRRGFTDPRPGSHGEEVTSEMVAQCAFDAPLDTQRWSYAGLDFASGLGMARTGVTDATGAIRPSGVLDLARFYLAHGMGREVVSLLGRRSDPTDQQQLLLDLALILGGKAPSTNGPVLAAGECSGRIKLWQLASNTVNQPVDDYVWSGAKEALLELSPELRRVVGRLVAQGALARSDAGAAREIFQLLDRTPGQPTADETVVRAELSLLDNMPEQALRLTEPLVNSAQIRDARALITHANAVLNANAPVSPELLSRLDTALYQSDANVLEQQRLSIVQAMLTARAGDPATAMAQLDRNLRSEDGDREVLRAAVLRILGEIPPTDRSGIPSIETILLAIDHLGQDVKSTELRLAYADALNSAGLHRLALRLTDTPDQLLTQAQALIRARAEVGSGKFDMAMKTLDGLRSDEASELRASVYLKRGQISAAYDALGGRGSAGLTDTTELALLSGAWDELPEEPLQSSLDGLLTYARIEAGEFAAQDSQLETDKPDALTSLNAARDALAAASRLQSGLAPVLDN
ncbi:MAG: hypothetical protein AAGA19_13200 [Pseudomonadota bacterium]